MAELVYSFLIPETEKMSIRQRGIIIVIMTAGLVVKILLLSFFFSAPEAAETFAGCSDHHPRGTGTCWE